MLMPEAESLPGHHIRVGRAFYHSRGILNRWMHGSMIEMAMVLNDTLRDTLRDAYDEFRASGHTWLPCGAYACDPLLHTDGRRAGDNRCCLVIKPGMDEDLAIAQAQAAGLTVAYLSVERRFEP